MQPAFVTIAFRGQDHRIYMSQGSTFEVLLEQLQAHVPQPLARHTLKLLLPHAKGSAGAPTSINVQQQAGTPMTAAGVWPGMRCVLLGSFSSELQAVQAAEAAHAALRLPSFEHEAQRVSQRAAAGCGSAAGPTKPRVGLFQVLPARPGAPASAPPPSAALALLHRLAGDPAIVHIMTMHGWSVGLMSEMPPEGRVGISAVCILGYNVNRGQEVSLRLRTDDYAGFRKYLAIRRTLVHELTHMVWDDHDDNFKQLNSQLLAEVDAYDATAACARTLVGGQGEVYQPQAPTEQQQASRARRLADAAGGSALQRVLPAPQIAAAAALARWQREQQAGGQQLSGQQQQQQQPQQPQQQQQQQAAPNTPAGAQQSTLTRAASCCVVAADAVAQALAAAAAISSSAGDAASSADGAAGVVEGQLQHIEHEDPATAAAEAAVLALEGLSCSSDCGGGHAKHVLAKQQQQQEQEQEQQQQQQQQPKLQPQQQQAEQLACQLPPGDASSNGAPAAGRDGAATSPAMQQQPHHPAAAHAAAAESRPAAAAAAAAPGASQDDVVEAKLQRARRLLQELRQQAAGGGHLGAALQVLCDVLANIAAHPHEPRFQRLRLDNVTFWRKAGRFPAALELLVLAGFERRRQEGGEVLAYTRGDPGLLWLVLSLSRDEAAGGGKQ